jgi:hypothetical protein
MQGEITTSIALSPPLPFNKKSKRLFWVSNPLCLSSSSALHFSDYSFWVQHLVNRDDQHLLAHAMASDFSVAKKCLSKRTIDFLKWI